MWHDAVLVAGKDLRIEARARVALWQVVPFAVLVLVLLAFAIGPDQSSLRHAAPGIFWVALLFSTVLAIQRSVAVESGEGTRDGLRLSGIDPAGIFLGKAAAVGLQLLLLQVVLWAGITFLFDVRVHVVWLAVTASLLATACSTAPCPPACASATRCCRYWCSPSSPRCCWPVPRRGRPRSTATPPRAPSGSRSLSRSR